MQYKDYYKTLGVDQDATQDQIKQAYRRLARKYHPDVSKEKDAEEQFKAVGEAYEVLKDPEKRAAYDQLGNQWQAGQEFHPPPNWDAGFEFSGDDASVFSDFFESLFGRARRPSSGFAAHGRDHHAKVMIDLEDAYTGATRQISLNVPYVDETGHVRTRERTLNVRIPKGVQQGQQVRLSGQGDPGVGQGKAGDLYLEIEFRPHALYRAKGRDVYLDLPVAPWELALGAQVRVPTPAGKVEMSIPASSQSGSKLRLAGKGIPGKTSGDLYVILQCVVPPAKTDQERQIYEDMEREMAFNPRQRLNV
ncbi:MAG: DnaJ C-terminal domain-containing protein [Arenicellales bacterium]|nr:DnaJ C-terminal domain-containing protein [Arenicellales bacterium]